MQAEIVEHHGLNRGVDCARGHRTCPKFDLISEVLREDATDGSISCKRWGNS